MTPRERRQAARTYAEIAARAARAPRVPASGPLVSVVIATYNWSSVLRHAIASVLAQRYANLELIVVGDGCTDDSEEVVGRFSDPRVRWHGLAVNSGSQSAPNNAGLELARGTYVAYLGHDDLWLPSHLQRLVPALEHRGAGIGMSVCQAVGPPGSNVRRHAGVLPFYPHRWCPPSALVHRRDLGLAVGGWRDYRELVDPPDQEFVSRLAGTGARVAHVRALTVCKFNSAWRPGSYRERRSDEQQAYAARIPNETRFVLRELATLAWIRARRAPERLVTVPELPAGGAPPGWLVGEVRRIRGLEDDPAGP